MHTTTTSLQQQDLQLAVRPTSRAGQGAGSSSGEEVQDQEKSHSARDCVEHDALLWLIEHLGSCRDTHSGAPYAASLPQDRIQPPGSRKPDTNLDECVLATVSKAQQAAGREEQLAHTFLNRALAAPRPSMDPPMSWPWYSRTPFSTL